MSRSSFVYAMPALPPPSDIINTIPEPVPAEPKSSKGTLEAREKQHGQKIWKPKTVLTLPPKMPSRRYKIPKHQEMDKQALKHHHFCINQIKRSLQQLEVSEDLIEGERLRREEMGQIYKSKLAELETQFAVYQEVKTRTLRLRNSLQSQKLKLMERELYRFQNQLPIYSKRMEIESHIESSKSRFLIIQGQTGSGKSTQLPQYLADHPKFYGKKILCTQPRKIAAISLAERVASEFQCGDPNAFPGFDVGFRVAGESVTSSKTRIEFITEGKMLESIIQRNPKLFDQVGVIILDEAHERSVTCDLLLGCFKTEDPRWREVQIIVTSATIDLDQFSLFFNQAPVVTVEGRTFPVTLNYIPSPSFGLDSSVGYLKDSVSCSVEIHMSQGLVPGDILLFLPGQADVLMAMEMFDSQYRAALGRLKQKGQDQEHLPILEPRVLPLYGRLEPEQQAKIFEILPARARKIIFATDIAETSVTIDGVVHVVDSGVKKGIVYDPKRKISTLRLQQISKSSAIQRMGRAGRTQPGECYRLYTPEDFETMEFGTNPEVLRRPLALAVLTLRKLQMDPRNFSWISEPPLASIVAAEEELILLGALVAVEEEKLEREDGCRANLMNLTELGHLISSVQQEPGLVKMIYYACQHGFGEASLTLASIFSVSNIFYWNGVDPKTKAESATKRKEFSLPEGDIVSLFRVFEQWDRVGSTKTGGIWCRDNFVNGKAMKIIKSTAKELRAYFRGTKPWKSIAQDRKPTNAELCRIAFSGHFLNTSHIVMNKHAQGRLQYYALHTGVLGNCSRDSTLGHFPTPPKWIIYDRVLQVPVTLLLTCNQIQEDWIREEDEDFYKICVEKSLHLPTELKRILSPEIIFSLLGKFYSNLNSLENEFESSIDSDMNSGRLCLYCPQNQIERVGRLLDAKIESVLTQLQDRVVEQDYLGGCRLLIGQGFEIKDVLFSEDFVTLYLRNFPIGIKEEEVREFIMSPVMAAADGRIHQIQLLRGEHSGTAIVTFYSKEYALEFHQKLILLFYRGQKLSSNPSLSKRRGISAEITGKLKFSWSTGPSRQTAKIWFKPGGEANSFIEHCANFLFGAIVSGVCGNGPNNSAGRKAEVKNRHKLPPVFRTQTSTAHPAARFRFDIEQIRGLPEAEQIEFEYAVTVRNIPLDLDEYGIKEELRHLNVTGVRVERMPPPELAKLEESIRTERLLPVSKWLRDCPSHEFSDNLARRSGISISFNRLGLLRDAYREIVSSVPWREMKRPFGQPQRLEIEYFYTATILKELYHVFESEIKRILDYAKSLKIHIPKPPQSPAANKSKFICLRFQSHTETHFPEIQRMMEDVTACTKFESDSIRLLFTLTGKRWMENFYYRRYLFTSFHSQSIWIYGGVELRGVIAQALDALVADLESLDFLDHQFSINKRIVKSNRERENILKICNRARPPLEFHCLMGSKLTVSGRKVAVEALQRFLEENKLIFNHKSKSTYPGDGTQECGLCFTPPEIGKSIITTNCNATCGKIFCQECLQAMFEQVPPPFLVKCPICESPLVINEIVKWAPPASLRKIMEVAVQDYKVKNSEKVLSCPKPGCEQILSTSSIVKGHYGGDFIFCDECLATYCLTCSKKMDKPVMIHEDESCEDIQSGTVNVARIHVKKIRETILNLQCPRCNVVFANFDGCGALTCAAENCRCHFCALCLEDCGSDAHSHVITCRLNPRRDFYISESALIKAHKTLRIGKIKEYLKRLSDEEGRRIMMILCKDLMDLGINPNEIS